MPTIVEMVSATLATASCSRTPRDFVSFEGGLHPQLGALLLERDALHEEVRQLRAALQLYREVVRRLQVNSRKSVAGC